jgi:hypothetical protein
MYILDLHGNNNSNKENVFAIKLGVAIGLMVKLP